MIEFKLDFNETAGEIKPMNAVNNGPVGDNIRSDSSNFEEYRALRIPYARNHDASHYNSYGGEHIVDVHRIFKNFDADECDPASYFFGPTDAYVKNTLDAGAETFYRLGASIEHWVKYGTRAPKDFLKWARICEHIPHPPKIRQGLMIPQLLAITQLGQFRDPAAMGIRRQFLGHNIHRHLRQI